MPNKTTKQSYVYFSLFGDEFDPQIISKRLGISPGFLNGKEDLPKRKKTSSSTWDLHSKTAEYLDINIPIDEVIHHLNDKIKLINSLKDEFYLDSVLEIVLYINDEVSTPFFGYDLSTIKFLYETRTRTDVDIYRFDSTDI